MDASQIAFLVLLIVGLGLLLISALFGELADLIGGHVGDLGGDGSGDAGSDHGAGPSWASLTILAVAATGVGAAGLVGLSMGLNGWAAALVGIAAGALFAWALMQFILKPMMKQQANTSISQRSYVGLRATVTLAVSAEHWGEVRLVDANGAVVAVAAHSSAPEQRFTPGDIVVVDEVISGRVLVSAPPAQ